MLVLIAEGHSNESIAVETSYSRQAVTWHLSRMMRERKAPNRAGLVSFAFVTGVLRLRRRRTSD